MNNTLHHFLKYTSEQIGTNMKILCIFGNSILIQQAILHDTNIWS